MSSTREADLFQIGQVVAERYCIVRHLGQGGMATVYQAFDRVLGERVALKVMRPDTAGSGYQELADEVRLARKVSHPNVCRVHDLTETATASGPVWLLTMEFLNGSTLEHVLRDRGSLSTAETLPILSQLIDGLTAIHKAGVVHRDLKPSNIILVPADNTVSTQPSQASVAGGVSPAQYRDSRVVITDFGIARPHNPAGSGDTRTDSAGTPEYMAPEQLLGTSTPASDIYSLGLVLYRMLSGISPFRGIARSSNPGREPSHIREVAPMLDPVWADAIMKCLSTSQARRFKHGRDLLAALQGNRGRRRAPIVVAAAIVVAGALFGLRRGEAPPSASLGLTTVAVVAFKSTGLRTEGWDLSSALSEHIITELTRDSRVRVIPGEYVSAMKHDFSLSDQSGYGAATLARICRHLGADAIVSGTYYVVDDLPDGELDVDGRIQKCATADVLKGFRVAGRRSNLADLSAGAAGHVLLGLGITSSPSDDNARTSNPTRPESARLYDQGLEKLRAFEPQVAAGLLEQAVAAEPEFALGHLVLSRAWADLGYEEKARSAAARALALSPGLSRFDRSMIEGHYHEMHHEWSQAAACYADLLVARKGDLAVGQRLAAAQLAAGMPLEALKTLRDLRSSPHGLDDPRLDLIESRAAHDSWDVPHWQVAAHRAAEKAAKIGANLLVGAAKLEEVDALLTVGKPEDAEAAAGVARRAFERAGDRASVARADALRAGVLRRQGKLEESRAKYQEALAIARDLGQKRLMSQQLTKIGWISFELGDPAAARRHLEEVIALERQIGSPGWIATSVYHLGHIQLQMGDLDGAERSFQEALAGYRQVPGMEMNVALLEGDLATIRYLHGDLAGAIVAYDTQVAKLATVETAGLLAGARALLGDLHRQADHLPRARQLLEESLATLTQVRGSDVGEVKLLLARVAAAEGKTAEALSLLRSAAPPARADPRPSEEAERQAHLAITFLEAGDQDAAAGAACEADRIGHASQIPRARLLTTIARGRTLVAEGSPPAREEGLSRLRAAVAEADRLGFVPLRLEARLALGRARLATGEKTACADLEATASEASERGFRLIARQARGLCGK